MDINYSKEKACSICFTQSDPNILIKLSCDHLLCHSCCFRQFYFSLTDILSTYITTKQLKIKCSQCLSGDYELSPNEIIRFIKEDNKDCEMKCKKHKTKADMFCTQCESFFCEDCMKIHNDLGNSHHIISKGSLQKAKRCAVHDSKLKYFCLSCKRAICSCCVSLDHSQHSIKHLSEYVKEALENIREIKEFDLKEIIDGYSSTMNEFNNIFQAGYTKAIKEIDYTIRTLMQMKEDYKIQMTMIRGIQMNINEILITSCQKVLGELKEINSTSDINKIMFYNDIWIGLQLPIVESSSLPVSPRKLPLPSNYPLPIPMALSAKKESKAHSRRNSNSSFTIAQLITHEKLDTMPDSVDLNNNNCYQFERSNSNRSKKESNHTHTHANSCIQINARHQSNHSSKDITLTYKKTLNSHKSQVKCLLELPNGNLVSGAYKEIKVWDRKHDYIPIKTIQAHDGYITSLTLLIEGSLQSCGENGAINIWDINNSFKLLNTIKGKPQSSLSVLLTNGKIASIVDDCNISIKNAEDNYSCMQLLPGHKNKITALILVDKALLISASTDSTIRVWKQSTHNVFECKVILKDHTEGVNGIIPINHDRHLLSCSDDLTIKLWDITKGFNCIQSIDAHKGFVSSLLLLSDGTIVSASSDSTIKLWNQHKK